MFRNIVALFLGIAAAVAVVSGVEWISHRLFDVASSADLSRETALLEFMASLPVGAILMIGAAWTAGAFVGSLVAGKLGTLRPEYSAVTVSGLILAASITSLILIPHPLWFNILSPLAVVFAGWLAVLVLKATSR